MRNQEAIEVLKNDIEICTIQHEQACDMAIKALEQQPCDDCISRKAVRQLICKNNDKYGYSDRFHEFVEQCLQLPSVTPQPKTGHWITTRTFMHDGEYYCDKCKSDSPNNEKWDYCPNCGAKMEVNDDDE